MLLLRSSVLSVLFSLLANVGYGQNKRDAPPIDVLKNQEQYVSYWTNEVNWHSDLQLRNNSPDTDLTVFPSLRSPEGSETALRPVTVHPQEVTSIHLTGAISAAGTQLPATFGSVVLRYKAVSAHILYAALMVHRESRPIAFHIDAMGQLENDSDSFREGIWWLPNRKVKDYLILTNQGNDNISANLTLTDAAGNAFDKNVNLEPRQTARLSMRELLQASGLSGSFGGIQVHALGHAKALDTLHVLFDEDAGFSALLKMFDRDPQAKIEDRDFAKQAVWTIRAPMLALSHPDPALSFPKGTLLNPLIFLRNTLPSPTKATVTFFWKSATTSGKTAGPVIVLNPNEVREIRVSSLDSQQAPPPGAYWSAVSISTTVKPDALVAVAASFDASLRYGAQTPFSDQLSSRWEGGEWIADSMHDSITTVGNGSLKPMKAAFTLFYDQGTQRYDLEQKLEPNEQMWVDIGDLIRSGRPDINGKILPKNLTTGSYQYRDLTNPLVGSLYEGKVIYDLTNGVVTYGCAACCSTRSVFLNYDPFNLGLSTSFTNGVSTQDDCGDPAQDDSSAFDNWSTQDTSIAITDIGGTHTGISVGSTTSNTFGQVIHTNGRNGCYLLTARPSGPTNVIQPVISSITPSSIMVGTQSVQLTISGSGFGSSPSVNLPSGFTQSGIASTTTTIVVTGSVAFVNPTVAQLSVSANGATSNQASLTLNGPNHTLVSSDVIGQTTSDPSALSRFVTYTVYNVDGTPVSSIPIAESISLSSFSCQQADPGNVTAACDSQNSTNTNGTFVDEWGMYTGYTPAGCGKNIVDHWQWCGVAGSNPPAPNPGITFQTISGFIHTVDSQINGYTNPPNPIPQNTQFNP